MICLQGMGLIMLHVGTKQLHGLWAAQGLTSATAAKVGNMSLLKRLPCTSHLCMVLPMMPCRSSGLSRVAFVRAGHGLCAAAEVSCAGHGWAAPGARAGWGCGPPAAHPCAGGRRSPAALLPACRRVQPAAGSTPCLTCVNSSFS